VRELAYREFSKFLPRYSANRASRNRTETFLAPPLPSPGVLSTLPHAAYVRARIDPVSGALRARCARPKGGRDERNNEADANRCGAEKVIRNAEESPGLRPASSRLALFLSLSLSLSAPVYPYREPGCRINQSVYSVASYNWDGEKARARKRDDLAARRGSELFANNSRALCLSEPYLINTARAYFAGNLPGREKSRDRMPEILFYSF